MKKATSAVEAQSSQLHSDFVPGDLVTLIGGKVTVIVAEVRGEHVVGFYECDGMIHKIAIEKCVVRKRASQNKLKRKTNINV
ncbi:hypothetical protein SH501x_002086 [Pirellulaceae bacterium SH501]